MARLTLRLVASPNPSKNVELGAAVKGVGVVATVEEIRIATE
jgi:hypothetical protein